MGSSDSSEREREALRAIGLLVQRGRFEDARAAIETLGDGESVARRALTALIHASTSSRSNERFVSWRRYVAESDAYLNGFFGTELPALVGPQDLARTFESNEALVSVLEGVVVRLEAGDARVPPTMRARSVEILHALPRLGAEAALQSFEALQKDHPRSVQVRCYRGELLLWLGRYREAWRSFATASRIEPTRWAEIGKLAVLALTGHLRRAAEQSELAEQAFRPLSSSSLPVYRGVFERRAGRVEAAIAHLADAIGAKPTRLGARVELCLALRAANRGSEAVSHVAVVLREAMPLLLDAAGSLGIEWRSDRSLLAGTDVLEQALRAMRGNRSSAVVTWFDRKGVLRALERRAS